MLTLTPEHVAAHLPEASFVCRGEQESPFSLSLKIVGSSDVDHPLSEQQLLALTGLRGLALEEQHEQRILISARADLSPTVDDLSRVFSRSPICRSPIFGTDGLEISTHEDASTNVLFCNIIGRESYQARSREHHRAVEALRAALCSALWRQHPTQCLPLAHRRR